MKATHFGIFFKIFVAATTASFLFLAFLPTVVSTKIGTSLLLKAINSSLAGELKIEELELSWFGGQKISNLTLKDRDKEEALSILQIEWVGSLPSLFLNPLQGNLRIIGLKVHIVQDANGVTNLEDILKIKEIIPRDRKVPVFIENVNIEVKKSGDENTYVKAVGLTRQNNIKGQFSLDATVGNTTRINLKAERFPVLVLDQTLSIQNPKLSGLLLTLLGEYFSVTIDQKSSGNDQFIKLLAKSPFVDGNIEGEIKENILKIKPTSTVEFTLPAQNIQKLASLADFGKQIRLEKPLQGSFALGELQIPLIKQGLEDLTGKLSLNLETNGIAIEGTQEKIEIERVLMTWNALPKKEWDVEFQGKFERYGKPVFLEFSANVPKESFLSGNFISLFKKGIRVNGSFQGNLAFLPSYIGSDVWTKWSGLIKEENTLLKVSAETEITSFPELQIQIDALPVRELFEEGYIHSDIEGLISLKKPRFFVEGTDFEEITIPWTLDPDGRAVNISFTFIGESQKNREQIKGTLRLNNYPTFESIDLSSLELQLNLKLQNFQIAILQPFLKDHDLLSVIGSSIDADIVANKDNKKNISGSIQVNSLKNSEAFLKSLKGSFKLENENSDLTFEASTVQAIGATHFQGTFHELFDGEGQLRWDLPAVSLKGHLKHFPVRLMTQFATGDLNLSEKMEAVLGSQVDADIAAEIREWKGPLQASLKGLNGELKLDGYVDQGVLYLKNPLVANLKVTPQLEQAVLREMLPLLGSVIQSDKPIEFLIAKEGFKWPLNSLYDMEIGHAELHLHKMHFSREGQLGKVVSLLGINSNTFEVLFTPIYFSFHERTLHLKRTDMLIAESYPLASWGAVDIGRNQLNLTVAISSQAIKKAFGIKRIKNRYMLQIPIRGSIHRPELDTAQVAARLSALAVQNEASGQNKLIGAVVDVATDLIGNEKIPPPTTDPLPWHAHDLQEEEMEPSKEEKLLEKPLDELKKNAKSLLKGLFGNSLHY